ncbi:sulfolipid synthase [Micractinium conductrix]|uniref:Sulfolipid synthase n=1 Tax=Micractinium conductrix TaxID=554055 RepID=A0A2P6VJ34_9CHLO|nr:sulfolipid synthase [Micractinium conductrix]|eukprot:PSC74099.1 sulfolipid synthase [Micractinium conductrix]
MSCAVSRLAQRPAGRAPPASLRLLARWAPARTLVTDLTASVVLPRLPRRHLTVHAAAAAADYAAGSGADPAAGAAPGGPLPRQPRRVCIMVEPSPFTYVCGYMNRYRNTIRFLTEAGVEVLVVTPGPGMTLPGSDFSAAREQPAEFEGARVVQAFSFGLPWYLSLPLSFGLSPRIYREIKAFKPDIVHCSSPGIMWLAALLYSRLLRAPLVYSYHTHVPEYMPRYGVSLLIPAMWAIIRFFHAAAHLTLVTSGVMAKELAAQAAPPAHQVEVWKKGVCSDTFHPRFRSTAMRERLTGGSPEAPLLLSVGRLGNEKNLKFLKDVLARVPGARLAFVGDGPAREELQAYFAGTPTLFAGMLHGEELSAAYASADVFVMPSETETLGFVVLEAMASGVPVVAVRAGGIPDIITKQGQTGYLYAPGDVEAAAEQVNALVQDGELRARVGAASRQEVSLWDWRAATQHLVAVQYPLAMAAAAVYYGRSLGSVTAAAAAAGGGDAGAGPLLVHQATQKGEKTSSEAGTAVKVTHVESQPCPACPACDASAAAAVVAAGSSSSSSGWPAESADAVYAPPVNLLEMLGPTNALTSVSDIAYMAYRCVAPLKDSLQGRTEEVLKQKEREILDVLLAAVQKVKGDTADPGGTLMQNLNVPGINDPRFFEAREAIAELAARMALTVEGRAMCCDAKGKDVAAGDLLTLGGPERCGIECVGYPSGSFMLRSLADMARGLTYDGYCSDPPRYTHGYVREMIKTMNNASYATWFNVESQADDAVVFAFQLMYEHHQTFLRQRWLGVVALQNPFDAWSIQDVIFTVKPDLIIETGTANGGSALMWASMLHLIGQGGKVITIDIDDVKKANFGANAANPWENPLWEQYVTIIQGSSLEAATLDQVKQAHGAAKRTLVLLDSNHQEDHVAQETELYCPFASPGSYCIVQDTKMGRFNWMGPMAGMERFLAKHPEFSSDRSRELYFTDHPRGYLKRQE